MTRDLQLGDQVVVLLPRVARRGPLRVRGLDLKNGMVEVEHRTVGRNVVRRCFNLDEVVKLEPGQSVQQALIAHVPESQRCHICNFRPGSESHFVTVPIPKAFTRLCVEDRADIVQEIRKRVSDIVAEVFVQAKAGQLKKALERKSACC